MRIRLRSIQIYMLIAFVITAAAITAIALMGAHRLNRQYLFTQQITAKFENEDAYEYLRGQTRLMVYWQEAFDNTVRKWNDKWVTYQFGQYEDTMGNQRTALIGPDHKLRFLHAPQSDSNITAANFMQAAGLKALLQKTRAAGVKRPPTLITGAIVIGGKPYYAVAAPIAPENEPDLALANRAPVIAVFFKPLLAAGFDEFMAGFVSDDVHIAVGGALPDGYQQHGIEDAGGHPVAWLRWRAHLPGDDFIRLLALPVGLALLIFTLVQAMVIGRWLSMQRRMIQAEAEISAAQEQSRLKSVFLGTISHELRTPLNAIIGYADVLCSKLFGPLGSARNEEYVRDIRASGHQLLKSINDLIEIARIEAGDKAAENDAFDVGVAAHQAVRTVLERAQAKQIYIALQRPETPVYSRGSIISLAQAMERILSNAIRHSPAGSRVAVEISKTARSVVIEITDHGCGIAKERLADLMRPFGHPDNHLIATGNKGMGFGIPIAKGLVQLMGGTLTIASKPGLGTRVRIILPVEAAPKLPLSSKEEAAGPPSGVFWSDAPSQKAGSQR